MIIDQELREQFGDRLEENVLLRDFTSIGVGGIADGFFRAERVDDLVEIVSFLSRREIPYFILGGGYNIVVSDVGFPGVVIKNEVRDIVFSAGSAEVIASSGVEIARLLMDCASRDFGGLEFLFGIPGTIGGAVYGNAGAFGHAIGDFVKSVTILLPGNKDRETKIIRHSGRWLEFQNRSSKIKEFSRLHPNENKPVILSVKLQLAQSKKGVILAKMQENFRQKKISQPLEAKSAGCFFLNPGEQKEQSAGYLLDGAKAKKLHIADAVVSKKHANFVINKNKATAEDIRRLANLMKDLVRAKFRTNLEEEIEYVGKW
ncbi:MAG: UDP-N-acetylmuramate dehydrogenase [Candidatus Berkelbacteria bacterium]|nr:UDP-N-acetylmuramate dehydrogenase [Candidatus Berkelbacteria bacterium]